jgi:hypothetical protein
MRNICIPRLQPHDPSEASWKDVGRLSSSPPPQEIVNRCLHHLACVGRRLPTLAGSKGFVQHPLHRLFVPTNNCDLCLETDTVTCIHLPILWQRISNLVDSNTNDCMARLTLRKTRAVRCITCNYDGAECIQHASSGLRVNLLVNTFRKRAKIPLLVTTGLMLCICLLRVARLLLRSESNGQVWILIFFTSGSCELLFGYYYRIANAWSRRINHYGSGVGRWRLWWCWLINFIRHKNSLDHSFPVLTIPGLSSPRVTSSYALRFVYTFLTFAVIAFHFLVSSFRRGLHWVVAAVMNMTRNHVHLTTTFLL